MSNCVSSHSQRVAIVGSAAVQIRWRFNNETKISIGLAKHVYVCVLVY
jgi:hypothetical protein